MRKVKFIRTIFLILLTILVANCHSPEVVLMESEGDVNEMGELRVGKVILGDSCPVVIETMNGDVKMLMYPVNLDERFFNNGMTVRFTCTPSRAKQPLGCLVDAVVSIGFIEEVKRN
jgi:hypothetical protein